MRWLGLCLLASANALECTKTPGTLDSTIKTSADLVTVVEEHVRDVAKELQKRHDQVIKSSETGAQCSYLPAAQSAHAKWQSATVNERFNNRETCTCLRFDRDGQANYLSVPITGRPNTGQKPPYPDMFNSNKCYWKQTVEKYDPSCNPCCSATAKVCENPKTNVEATVARKCVTSKTVSDPSKNCKVLESEYAVNFPDGTNTNSNQINAEICATNYLQKHFELFTSKYSMVGWNWLGMHKTGMYRNWPAIYQARTEAQCSGCSDPRFRGWYASAASGPKNVVMVLDKSGSMAQASRLNLMKSAAKWVLNTLTPHDYVTVVVYSTVAESPDFTAKSLVPATPENKLLLADYIQDLGAGGSTNMGAGISEAFNALNKAHSTAGGASPCQDIILFMTDGANTGGRDPVQVADNAVASSYMTGNKLRLFTYTFGTGAEQGIPRRLACGHNGAYQHIQDGGNLKKAMASYFTYLAADVSLAQSYHPTRKIPIRWTPWFEDGQGTGQMAGACAPVFDTTLSPPDLFGVVCQGIHKHIWTNFSDHATEWSKIEKSKNTCVDLDLTLEQQKASLENMRKIMGADTCGVGNDSVDKKDDAESGGIGAAVGGAVGVIVAVIGGILILRCLKANQQKLREQNQGTSPAASAPPVPAYNVETQLQTQPVVEAQVVQAHVVQAQVVA